MIKHKLFFTFLLPTSIIEAKHKVVKQHKEDYTYYLNRTIEKINQFGKYNIEGKFMLVNKKLYTKHKIKYDDHQVPISSDINLLLQNWITINKEDNKTEKMQLYIHLHEKVILESQKLKLQASKNDTKIHLKMKLGPIPITHSSKVSEYLFIQKIISNNPLTTDDLENFQYKFGNITALLFYHKKSNIKNLEDFIIIILDNKDDPKTLYHINNIVGIILSIHGRTFMIKVTQIKTDK